MSESAVNRLLDQIRHVAVVPSTVVEVRQITDDPSAGVPALAKVIERDQALSARVVAVANSALLGLSGTIGTLDRAVFVLGFQSVRNIAIAASLSTFLRTAPGRGGPSPDDLWRHALAVATAAGRLAARDRQADGGEAFLAGLLHDIGITAELQYDQAKLGSVVARCATGAVAFREAEVEAFGASHEAFGAGLLRRWRFPDRIVTAVEAHHVPASAAPEHRTLTEIVAVADWMASRCGIGFAQDIDPSNELDPALRDSLGLGDGDVSALVAELPQMVGPLAG